MRTKNVKQAAIRLKESHLIQKQKQIINSGKPIYLEIGAGKGSFIVNSAKENKDILYVAVEKNESICYRILEKQEQLLLSNLVIICADAIDLCTYLKEKSVTKLFLNFSDPWPKKRHHKRRLTYYPFLRLYKKLLTEEGIIKIRTDSKDFFLDTITYLKAENYFVYDIINMSPEVKHMSEYEINKRSNGPIYSLKAKLEA